LLLVLEVMKMLLLLLLLLLLHLVLSMLPHDAFFQAPVLPVRQQFKPQSLRNRSLPPWLLRRARHQRQNLLSALG
jgi:hypothetical protein